MCEIRERNGRLGKKFRDAIGVDSQVAVDENVAEPAEPVQLLVRGAGTTWQLANCVTRLFHLAVGRQA